MYSSAILLGMVKFLARYRFPFIFIIITLIVSWFIATHIGLFELPDGFFYYVLGDYLLHGRLFTVFPFNATTPQTLFGPLYSIFLGFMIPRAYPWAMTGIPFIHLFLVGLSGLFLFYIAKLTIGKRWGYVVLPVFFFFPFLLIYSVTLMSEAVTLFLITTYSYLFVLLLKGKTRIPPSMLVLVGCILTLTKNAYILIVALSIPMWLFLLWRDRRKITPIAGSIAQIPILIGLIGILLWVRFNKTHHNTYALTNYTGRHLYNNVVHSGKMLPDKESKIYKEFFLRIGSEQNFYLPEYEVERYFIADFNAKRITEQEMDRKFMEFNIAAIKKQPLSYVTHVFYVAWNDLITAPYHAKILASLGEKDPTCPDCGVLDCRITWNAAMCKPQVNDPGALKLWASLVRINRAMYPNGMIVLAVLAGIGIIEAIIKRNKELVLLTGIFLLFLFVQAAAQRIEGRYLVPLYPLYVLCILNGLKTLVLGILPKKKS